MSDAILLIDDDASRLRTLGGYLEQQGFEVARELDGTAALAACDRMEPDAVILDQGVPAAGGKDLFDLTGNGLNHPNDYGHRLYAQGVLSLLLDESPR